MKFNYEVLADDSAKLTSIEEPEEEIVIPEELDGHKVSEIGSNVIPEGKSDVKSITLPQSVTTLDSEAFADHHYLKTLKLNQGLKAIGERAIYTCPDLAELYVPMSVTVFGAHCIGFMYEHARSYRQNYFTMVCEEGSMAHIYALDNQILYRMLPVYRS